MQPLCINETIDEMLDIMRADLRRHDVSLTTEFAGRLRPITGDRVQLQQVIANLVTNSIEAMSLVTDRSRELRVSTQLDGSQHVLVAVVDCGTGLDPVVADSIFDPRFTTKSEGLGIGLSICRSIVETHGGRIWAIPHWPHGTAFCFVLPQLPTARSHDATVKLPLPGAAVLPKPNHAKNQHVTNEWKTRT